MFYRGMSPPPENKRLLTHLRPGRNVQNSASALTQTFWNKYMKICLLRATFASILANVVLHLHPVQWRSGIRTPHPKNLMNS